ncbi:MAG: AmmeMemoRadiSam system protein B [Bacteroidetes bacterium]|nr:AmmeMemoRadiSam system protein B [Bacteroidota bacterium]
MGLSFTFSNGCSSQEGPKTDRKPAAAGKFYPANPDTLRAQLKELFRSAKPRTAQNLQAVICPHAGYVFSGTVAASGINQVDPDKVYDNIFIIGSSHQASYMGASIYNKGDYVTPLGKVAVNIQLANELIKSNSVFSYVYDADLNEHSLEVQVPFLQYHMKKPFKIVPVLLGSQSEQTCKKIAHALKPYFNGNNLFIVSSDFSHYPPYNEAKSADKATCDAILTNNPDALMKVLGDYEKKNIPNLATNLCGWTSVLTLLYMTAGDAGIKIAPVQYMNSGDSKYGDHSQCVGYWSIAVTRNTGTSAAPSSAFNFTKEEKKILLGIARSTIVMYINEHKTPEVDDRNFSPNLKIHSGAFVTLKEHGELRGCIGRFTADIPLWKVVQQMAIASSTEDTRFPPVTAKEIDKLEIEISVLSPMKKIFSADEIELGKHGIYIKKGYYSGTFLPQVANETGWSREEFLGHCARDKAGLGWDGWKDAELYTYEACVFGE